MTNLEIIGASPVNRLRSLRGELGIDVDEIERAARAIFEHWQFNPENVSWVKHGNSHKQNEARAYARVALGSVPFAIKTGVLAAELNLLKMAAERYMLAVKRLGEDSGFNRLTFFEAPISKMPDDELGMEAVRRWQELNEAGKSLATSLALPSPASPGAA